MTRLGPGSSSASTADSREAVLLTIADLAARWHTTAQAIYSSRYRGDGPPAVRIGRKLLWRLSDVEQWELAQLEEAPPLPTALPMRRIRF